jgi:SAM-dependent methyltransferase
MLVARRADNGAVVTPAALNERDPVSLPALHDVTAVLATPATDVSMLWELGVAGVALPQYLRWADDVDLFTTMADAGAIMASEVVARTSLTLRGADALLGVLCGLGLAQRDGDRYVLGGTAREYLDRRRPFYVGQSLYGNLNAALPPRLQKGQRVRRFSQVTHSLWDRLRFRRSRNQWGRPERLLVQHSRNFPAAVTAVRGGHFAGVQHLADIGGGSGVFAIPLALDYPDLRITLVELPRSLRHIERFLEPYDIGSRVTLSGFNVHEMPWPLANCDAILFGNFLHFCDDRECAELLEESARQLPPGGRLFIHEMLWNDRKDGPLPTALWNFWLNSVSAGRQRTRGELADLIRSAGFDEPRVDATAGSFSLITARRAG